MNLLRANTYKDIPSYDMVLRAFTDGLNETQRKQIAVILNNKETKTVSIVTTAQADRHVVYSIKRELKEEFVPLYNINTDPQVIEAIYDHNENATNIANNKIDQSQAKKDFEDLVAHAIKNDAQDIHIFISSTSSSVSYRVNKRLRHIRDYEYKVILAMVSASFNTLADTDSKGAEDFSEKDYLQCVISTYLPDLGQFRLRFQSSPKFPNGCKVVLRILHINDGVDQEIEYKDLTKLGFEDGHRNLIDIMSLRKKGLVVVAGETGSGKTTTVHNMLTNKMLKNPWLAINTVEDPPEYVLPGTVQTPVKGNGGTDDSSESPFALALKANMRLDPDIIFNGETRDKDTAITCQAAVSTGHQVFTTLHTSSCVDVVQRLVDLQVERKVIGKSGFISGLIYQDLMPEICPSCKIDLENSEDKTLLERARALVGDAVSILKTYEIDDACRICYGSGVKGMTVCAEILLPNTEISEAIYQGEDGNAKNLWLTTHKKLMREQGGEYSGVTAQEHAIFKMLNGTLSPSDIETTFGHFVLLESVFREQDAWILSYIEKINEKIKTRNQSMQDNMPLDNFLFNIKEEV